MYQLLHMSRAELDAWEHLPHIGFRGIPLEDDALGARIVYLTSHVNLYYNMPTFFALRYFIHDKTNNKIVGMIGFRSAPKNNVVHIGYNVAPSYQGKGVATEAVRLLLELARQYDPNLDVAATTKYDNHISARVLQKNGFVFQGDEMFESGEVCHLWLRSAKSL